jgi:4,5-dihydroxyphthalate decarboxylase
MTKLNLTLACGLYDRTQPLLDGTVQLEGVNLNFIPLVPGETFWRMLNNSEFDVSEMSLSSYTILKSRGIDRFIAIPVFPSRIFRHSGIYINTGSGINTPADLKGKTIGVGDYQMTAAVWARGLLQDEYQLKPSDMNWVVGEAVQDVALPKDISISRAESQNPEQLLVSGKIDALISVMIPAALNRESSNIVRLFPDYRDLEQDYFRRTGIFPIMHTVVIKKDIYDKEPWLAISLYKAFKEAKQICYRRLLNTDALNTILPWSVNEMETTREIMGTDYWDYSIEGSRPTLDALTRYLYEQGLTEKQMNPDDLFVKNIDDGLEKYLHGTSEVL